MLREQGHVIERIIVSSIERVAERFAARDVLHSKPWRFERSRSRIAPRLAPE